MVIAIWLKIKRLTGLVITTATLFDIVLPHPAEAQQCVTYQDARSKVAASYQHLDNTPLPSRLPTGFNNGCVFEDHGASTTYIYVLKENIDPAIIPVKSEPDEVYNPVIPDMEPSATLGIESLVEEGSLIMFRDICTSNGTMELCQNYPKNQSFIPFNHENLKSTVCYNQLCLTASGVPKATLLANWVTKK